MNTSEYQVLGTSKRRKAIPNHAWLNTRCWTEMDLWSDSQRQLFCPYEQQHSFVFTDIERDITAKEPDALGQMEHPSSYNFPREDVCMNRFIHAEYDIILQSSPVSLGLHKDTIQNSKAVFKAIEGRSMLGTSSLCHRLKTGKGGTDGRRKEIRIIFKS